MSRRPTQEDVARLAGVSRATVSYVINDRTDGKVRISKETRCRVLEAVEELGYQPNVLARSLRRGWTHTIGMIVPDNTNPFFAEVARAVEDTSFEQGYSVILCNSDGDFDKELLYSNMLAEKQVEPSAQSSTNIRSCSIVNGTILILAQKRVLKPLASITSMRAS